MAQATTQKNNSTTAIIFAVFAVACVIAFLSFRGSDVGQLPKLIGNLGGWALFGGDVINYLFDSLKGLAISSAWVMVGFLTISFIQIRTDFKLSPRMVGPLSIATGAAIWSLVWFFLGLAGLYTRWTAIIAILVCWALVFIGAKLGGKTEDDAQDDTEDEHKLLSILTTKEKKTSDEEPPKSGIEKALLGLIYIQVGLSFIASLAPAIAKDTLLYHFALPKAFVAQGSNAFIDGNIASYLSLGTEMHVVWARLMASYQGADAVSGVVIWIFFPLLLLTIYAWAREIGISRTWSLIATAIVATIPSAYYVASSGYIDLSLALYVTLAVYALTRWWKGQSWGWVILIAIFLGAALSVKLTAVFVFAAFALIVLLRARDTENTGKIVASGFAALVLAGVIASPWYIRTWVATGSPVFPFYMSIWPGKAAGWDVERSNLFQAMNSQYGGTDTDKVNYLTAPLRVSVAAQPEQPANYDGVLGPAFLIGLPLIVWALWKFDLPIEVKIAVGVAGMIYLFWLFSSEQLRYLLPITPLLAIAIAASAEQIGDGIKKVARVSLVAASICGLLTTSAWFLQKAPLRVVLGGETRDQYLTRNLDYYPYYQILNTETLPDARIWLINMRRDTYNLDRRVVSDYLFEDWTLRKMIWESRSVQELKAKAAAMNVQYVLTRHDFLFDYDRSTIVDDKKPRAENEAKLKMAKDFILDKANTIRSDEKFSLIKVF